MGIVLVGMSFKIMYQLFLDATELVQEHEVITTPSESSTMYV